MRTFLTVVTGLSCCSATLHDANAQCVIDAGPDIAICTHPEMDAVTIPATVEGAEIPYTVLWESEPIHIGSTIVLTAADFLNDVTLLQPAIVQHYSDLADSVFFHVTVTDGIGNTCTDSVQVRFSYFVALMAECRFEIYPGDTVMLFSNLYGGIQPLTYTWYPNHDMSDSTSASPGVWPGENILYHVNVWDAIGCGADTATVCRVDVLPVGVAEPETSIAFEMFPNPCQSHISIASSESMTGVGIFDVTGRWVRNCPNISDSSVTLDVSDLHDGIYVVRVLYGSGRMILRTLIKSTI